MTPISLADSTRGARRFFLASAVAIFVATALLKVVSLLVGGTQLLILDPLFDFLEMRYLIALVALLEVAVSCAVILPQIRISVKLFSVAWLSTLFAVYRIGLWVIGYKGSCFCDGGLQSWFMFLKALHLEVLMEFSLLYLLVLSYGFLLIENLSQREQEAQTARVS